MKIKPVKFSKLNRFFKLYKVSAANYSAVQTITLRVPASRIFVANGYLYYFGQYKNSYLLDKIKL
ncbi:MAG: hypothetical protein LBN23_06270 [Paludibacter sp.]|nr:hypothetical protein [Paludibacter sp.]